MFGVSPATIVPPNVGAVERPITEAVPNVRPPKPWTDLLFGLCARAVAGTAVQTASTDRIRSLRMLEHSDAGTIDGAKPVPR
jgi:hypothetical protein